MLLFKGAISQNTLIRIGGLLDLNQDETIEDHSKKRLFSVLVEMAQNILHYSQERELNSGSHVGTGTVLVQETTSTYEVECSNLVNERQKQFLENHCAMINKLNPEQLREYYLKQRHNGTPHPDSKGAGLGLVEIARKSRNPLVTQFVPADDNLYYYSISTKLPRHNYSN